MCLRNGEPASGLAFFNLLHDDDDFCAELSRGSVQAVTFTIDDEICQRAAMHDRPPFGFDRFQNNTAICQPIRSAGILTSHAIQCI